MNEQYIGTNHSQIAANPSRNPVNLQLSVIDVTVTVTLLRLVTVVLTLVILFLLFAKKVMANQERSLNSTLVNCKYRHAYLEVLYFYSYIFDRAECLSELTGSHIINTTGTGNRKFSFGNHK